MELLDAIQQPKQLAIITIPGHSKASTMKAHGNHFTDAAARRAALNSPVIQIRECSLLSIKSIEDYLLQFQQTTTEEEKRIWKQKQGNSDPDRQIWLGPNQKPILPLGAHCLYFNMYIS